MILEQITENWAVWFVTTVLIVAAVIDGAMLKVPNWLTFPFIIGGWMHCTIQDVLSGFGGSLVGTCVGMCLLLFLRNVGGMGAGDVRLLAGVGAWLGATTTLYAFAATAIVGGVMAVVMVLKDGSVQKHLAMGHQILSEWKTAGSAKELAGIARERKPTMMLLPYGIPMAIGSIAYFAFAGLLLLRKNWIQSKAELTQIERILSCTSWEKPRQQLKIRYGADFNLGRKVKI